MRSLKCLIIYYIQVYFPNIQLFFLIDFLRLVYAYT